MLFHFLLPMTMITLVMTVDHSILENTHFTPAQNKQLFAFDLIAGALSIGFLFMSLTKEMKSNMSNCFFSWRKKTQWIKNFASPARERNFVGRNSSPCKNNLAIITSLLNLQSEKLLMKQPSRYLQKVEIESCRWRWFTINFIEMKC